MTPALYADDITELRTLFGELDQHPDRFQTYNLHVDLAAAGNLVVYETKRQRGQVDSIYYGRPSKGGAPQRISQATAFAAIDRFFSLGQFLALKTGTDASELTVDAEFPHCAVSFSYRKKGAPAARSMLMIFVGFNDDADALTHASSVDGKFVTVAERPLRTDRVFEWK